MAASKIGVLVLIMQKCFLIIILIIPHKHKQCKSPHATNHPLLLSQMTSNGSRAIAPTLVRYSRQNRNTRFCLTQNLWVFFHTKKHQLTAEKMDEGSNKENTALPPFGNYVQLWTALLPAACQTNDLIEILTTKYRLPAETNTNLMRTNTNRRQWHISEITIFLL